ncbi:hypothetical protein VFPFJ_05957 [Purpureocillium lilacinum]|uniref:Uncharacterized protein n=1 Tax=Purpureocillium lilacinum TaxID=33203 RepID=A0A179H632_PURLI|nr:hypothetical protein VFPFJ_05957 [Purpureocillium lilacinum]OAQ84993.1 hypothetical protein VFPBJ_03765 [Purpureocillium lilacinum]OAQ89543.1 hypothetical protein VFPFJ_05957 [Purpureocillium lilacinum]PWI67931.1 hypothetical protein PCL_02332 [Purpureocillium lilacinum]GJN69246.1 hypothetical protein PLICBS_003294 [Purpureocillium lilacinum]
MKSFLAPFVVLLGAVTAAPAGESRDLQPRSHPVTWTGYIDINFENPVGAPVTVTDNGHCTKLPKDLWHNMRSIRVEAPAYNSGCALYHDDEHTQIVPLHNNGGSDRLHDGWYNTFHSYNAQAGSICCWIKA